MKTLRELRAATHMQEIATIFKEVADIYKRYYHENFLRRIFMNNVILVLKNI
ncbi:MAG: hypothetical protein ACTTIV_04100 [Campylobacter sp.]